MNRYKKDIAIGVSVSVIAMFGAARCKTPGGRSNIKSAGDIYKKEQCPTGYFEITCYDGHKEIRSLNDLQYDNVCFVLKMVAKADNALLIRVKPDGLSEMYKYGPPWTTASGFSPSNAIAWKGQSFELGAFSSPFGKDGLSQAHGPSSAYNKRRVFLLEKPSGYVSQVADILIDEFDIYVEGNRISATDSGYPNSFSPSGYSNNASSAKAYDLTRCWQSDIPIYYPSGYNPSGYNPSGYNPSGYNPSGYNPSGYNPSGFLR